jgi:hypothetical protein
LVEREIGRGEEVEWRGRGRGGLEAAGWRRATPAAAEEKNRGGRRLGRKGR